MGVQRAKEEVWALSCDGIVCEILNPVDYLNVFTPLCMV